MDTLSVPTEFHSTLCRTLHTLSLSVRKPITEVKAEWNVAADVWEIGSLYVSVRIFAFIILLWEALGEVLLPSHNWCGYFVEPSCNFKYLRVLLPWISFTFLKYQMAFLSFLIIFFQFFFAFSLLMSWRRYTDSGRSYLCRIWFTLINVNQLQLFSDLIRSCRWANWCSNEDGPFAMLRNVVKLLMSICASIVFTHTSPRTATEAVLSGRDCNCLSIFFDKFLGPLGPFYEHQAVQCRAVAWGLQKCSTFGQWWWGKYHSYHASRFLGVHT